MMLRRTNDHAHRIGSEPCQSNLELQRENQATAWRVRAVQGKGRVLGPEPEPPELRHQCNIRAQSEELHGRHVHTCLARR
jgi:hypothetical protein